MHHRKLVLVITRLVGPFWMNCPIAFLNILKLPKQNKGNFKILKLTRMNYPRNRKNQKYN